MEFYAALLEGTRELQQGDLLANVPFAYFNIATAQAIRPTGRTAIRDLSRVEAGEVIGVRAKVEFSWGLILTQTCDVQPVPETGAARRPIVIARVQPINILFPKANFASTRAAINEVKKLANPGGAPSTFYLPEQTVGDMRIERSAAYLLDTQRFPPDDLSALTGLLRLRLAPAALQALQERCAYCFGRFAAPDDLYFSEAEWQEF